LIPYRFLLIAIAILTFSGILDDFHEISPGTKLISQLLASFLIVFFGNLSINNLGNLLFLGPITLGSFSLFFTIIGTVFLINAINMIDGLDGLAGSILFGQFLFLAIFACHLKLHSDFKIIVLILSALLAFLYFNFPYQQNRHNKIFMGDVGSMILGLLLAWFLISITKKSNLEYVPVSLLWVIALPVYDMCSVIIIRLLKKRSPFIADRNHLHYSLKKRGLRDIQIVIILGLVSILFGLIGYLGFIFKMSASVMFIAFLIIFLIYFLMTRYSLKESDYAKKT